MENAARLDAAGRPHDSGNTPPTFKPAALHPAKRGVASIGPRVNPRSVVGRPHDDGILVQARVADGLHDPTRVAVEFHQRIEIVALMRFALELGRWVVGLVYLQKSTYMKNGLSSLA